MSSNLAGVTYKPEHLTNRDGQGMSLSYNPATGNWEPTLKQQVLGPVVIQGYTGNRPKKEDNVSKDTPVPDTTPTQVDSSKEAEKEFIGDEFNTLVGELSLVPSKRTIKVKVNDTITISGVGNYLSGNYFVSAVKRSISKDSGYTQSISVIKNGFGDKLKQPKVEGAVTPINSTPAPTSAPASTGTGGIVNTEIHRQDTVEKSPPAIKVGDSVKIVGDAIYSNAHEGVKVPEWVKKQTFIVKQISADGARVLLQPINSWTYIKFIQKV